MIKGPLLSPGACEPHGSCYAGTMSPYSITERPLATTGKLEEAKAGH
jgi:hypothetical protein